jgi:hypothetical protein
MTKNEYLRSLQQLGDSLKDTLSDSLQNKSNMQKVGLTQEQVQSVLALMNNDLSRTHTNFIMHAEKSFVQPQTAVTVQAKKKLFEEFLFMADKTPTKIGTRHVIKCRCILPQYKSMQNPPNHQFVVFSVTENDAVIAKTVQCNNCGIVHRVTELCTSKILNGKEELKSVNTIDTIRPQLPSNIAAVLDAEGCDVPVWEHCKFVIENAIWDSIIQLSTESYDGMREGKYIRIFSKEMFNVESFSEESTV